jgi:hypothetical protein
MKNVKYYFLILSIFAVVNISAQFTFVKTSVQPNAMLENLRLRSVQPVSNNIKLITAYHYKMESPKASINLSYQLAKVKGMCPLLQAKPSLTLQGDRETTTTVSLQWKAVNNYFSKQFVIERSLADTQHFEAVNFKWPQENAAQSDKYELQDANDYKQLSYYRIKLIQTTGSVAYSNIAKVNGYSESTVSVFPNPATNQVSILAANDGKHVKSIVIIDASGKIVTQQLAQGGANEGFSKQINVTRYSRGTYTIKVEFEDQSIRAGRFVKQ